MSKNMQNLNARLALTSLEDRTAPAFLLTAGLPSLTVEPGQEVRLAHEFLIPNQPSTIAAMRFQGNGDLAQDLASIELRADMFDWRGNRGPDGVFDTFVRGQLMGNTAHFSFPRTSPSDAFVPIQVVGTLSAVADGKVSLSKPTVVGSGLGAVMQKGVNNPVHTVAPRADLSVAIRTSKTEVRTGDTLTVTFAVTNRGPVMAQGTTMTSVLPGDFTVAGRLPSGVTMNGRDLRWNLGNVPSGHTRVATITVRVGPGRGDGPATFGAGVSSRVTDPDQSNNAVQKSVNVISNHIPRMWIATQNIGMQGNVVTSQRNVVLFRFNAMADAISGETRDLLFTGAKFSASQGNLANFQNFVLKVDTNSDGITDTILESGVAAMNGLVTFDSLVGGGFVLPRDERSVAFEVYGDVTSSPLNNTFQLQLASTLQNYITAERVDNGADLVGIAGNGEGREQIVVNADQASITYSITSNGSLFVSESPTVIRSHQLLGSRTSDTLMMLQLRADGEPIDVTKVQFQVTGARSVDRILLFKAGQENPFAAATAGTDWTVHLQNQQLIVPDGQMVTVLVKALIKSDLDGGVASDQVQLSISGSNAVAARGVISARNLAPNDGDNTAEGEVIRNTVAGLDLDLTSELNVVVMARISNIQKANPDVDGSAIPNGIADTGQWKISAATHSNFHNGSDDVVVRLLVIDENAENVELANSFVLFNKADSTSRLTGYATDLNGNRLTGASLTGHFLIVFELPLIGVVNNEIDQGSDATFVLQTNTLNSAISSTRSSRLTSKLIGIRWDDRDIDVRGSFSGADLPENEWNGGIYVG